MLISSSLTLQVFIFSLVQKAFSLPHETSANQVIFPTEQVRSYEGYELRRYESRDNHQLISAAKDNGIDIWAITDKYIDLYSRFDQLPLHLTGLFNSFPHEKSTPPLEYPTISSIVTAWNLTNLATSTFHTEYHPLYEVEEFSNQLAQQFPHQVQLLKLGTSSEGREIGAITIGRKSKRKLKPRIVIQGAQHAREWIATSTALYLAHALVVESQPHALGHLLDTWDITIIPTPNPDGYVYTWNSDRLWYKNRSPIEGQNECVGVDLNRNWGYQWFTDNQTCSTWYPGSAPFSAPETLAISSYIERTSNIKVFLDLRSYGQMMMHPFSYSCDELPADAEDLIEASLGATKALRDVHGTVVTIGSICEMLYSAPGNVVDWMYAESDIAFAYSLSLRDTGTYGFLLPPDWIRPVGEETTALVSYIAHWIEKWQR